MIRSPCVILFICVSLQTVFCLTHVTYCRSPITGDIGICKDVERCQYYNDFYGFASYFLRLACGYGYHNEICCPYSPALTTSFPTSPSPTAPSITTTSPTATSPIVTSPIASSPITTSPIASSPITTSPIVTSPIATSPIATSPTEMPAIVPTNFTIDTRFPILEKEDFVPELPKPPYCGVSNITLLRVVRAQTAKLGEMPWLALLGYKTSSSPVNVEWECTGSLITARHVLTAGHCIHNLEQTLYVVRFGNPDRRWVDDVLIKKMILHEKFNPSTYENDIGVLILQKNVEFPSTFMPICTLQDEELLEESFEDYNPLITGWGLTSYQAQVIDQLSVIQLPVLNNEVCVEAYRDDILVIDDRVMCVGYTRSNDEQCIADSGAPLMIATFDVSNDYFHVAGLVSFRRQCPEPTAPLVVTRITHFMPWIEEKVLGRTIN